MKVELTVMISICTAIIGAILGIVSARRMANAENDSKTRETATVISEIGYIKAGIDDIKRRQEKQDEKFYSLSAKVSALESDVGHLQSYIVARSS